MALKNPPEGYHTVTPSLISPNAAGLIQFITRAFGGQERMRMPMPDGKVAHAEVTVGDSVVMVSDANEMFPATSALVHLYVDDVDAVYQRALQAGATSDMEPADQFYGDRSANVSDPFGNRWSLATHVEDVPEDEMMRRMEAFSQQQ